MLRPFHLSEIPSRLPRHRLFCASIQVKIGQLFDAIEVTNFVPSAYSELLLRSWTTARFGAELYGFHDDAEALGSSLLKENDFFKARSGLTDDHRILFRLEEIKRDHLSLNETAIREHLSWMVDSRRNPQTIKLVLQAINEPLRKGETSSFSSAAPQLVLQRLAGDLSQGLANPQQRQITEALLTGKLHQVAVEAAQMQDLPPQLIQRIREMCILWALLDLQIMAARLFHAEWNVLEAGGLNDPNLVTVRSVNALIKDFMKKARALTDAFKAGKDGSKLGKKLDHFIAEHGLEAHAKRNAAAMGLSAHLPSGTLPPELQAELLAFLENAEEIAQHIHKAFGESMQSNARTYTRLQYAKQVNQTGKLKLAPDRFHSGKDREAILEANMSTSTIRFSMPVLTALIYAIQRMTATIGGLPTGDEIASHKADSNAPPALWDDRTQSVIKQRLIEVYRNLFARDHRRIADDKKDPFTLPDEEDDFALVPVAQAKNLPPKVALVMGAGQSPSIMVDLELERRQYGVKARPPKEAIRDANILEGYRSGPVRAPEELYIDRLFESSLARRLADPRHKCKKK